MLDFAESMLLVESVDTLEDHSSAGVTQVRFERMSVIIRDKQSVVILAYNQLTKNRSEMENNGCRRRANDWPFLNKEI